MILLHTMPAESSVKVKVVKRNEEDSHGEILDQKKFVLFVPRKARAQHNRLW